MLLLGSPAESVICDAGDAYTNVNLVVKLSGRQSRLIHEKKVSEIEH